MASQPQSPESVIDGLEEHGAASLAQFERDEHQNTYVVNERRADHADLHTGVPLLLADRYEVLEEIGSGATAVTYRGQDLRLHRNVAIKILRADHALDAGYVQRFEREARAAASISQGNVVDVYDFGEQGDLLYIVMQYIDGEDLKRMIARRGALDSERARELTTHILAGLTAIHAAGIIHRDIKPQNVLIGRDGIARVTDFGVAQVAIDVGLTSAGTTVGTAAYMAPEQAQAGTLGETTDIYAVGVVLYEMLTGQMPFTAPTPVAMMLAHIQREPLPPSRKAPARHIPEDLDAIVMQAMAKDPLDRFQSARAMSRALAGMAALSPSSTVVSTASVAAYAPDRPRETHAASREPVPATAGVAPLPPRVTLHPARAGSRLRSSAGGLLLFLSLALAGGGAYGASEWFGRDNGSEDDQVPIIRGVASVATPTAAPTNAPSAAAAGVAPDPDESGGSVSAPMTPTQAALDEPTTTAFPSQTSDEPSPTPEPTAPPTAVPPTAVPPTVVPPTSVPPTAVPPTAIPPTAVPPTEVPTTAVPPTSVPPTDAPQAVPTVTPVEQSTIAPAGDPPDQRGQGSNVAKRASQATGANPQATQQPRASGGGIVSSGSSSTTAQDAGAAQVPGAITIDHNDWKGEKAGKSSDQDWTVVGPGEEATARFDVDGAPSGGTFEVSIALAAVDDMQGPLRILLNGTERLEITDPLPVISSDTEGQTLGTLVLTVPSAFLQDGRNEITIVNGNSAKTGEDGDSDEDKDAFESGSIVLGDAIVTPDAEP